MMRFTTTALVALGLAGMLAAAAQEPPRPDAPPTAQEKAPPKGMEGMPDLVKGLKETPGCLGVDTAQTSSGKLVIFAWFKDKDALMGWYESDMHQRVMFGLAGGPSGREPLADVPDGSGPIMAVASITPSDRPRFKGLRMPVSQIAIELYRPLGGGIALGGRFAPEGMPVPNLKDLTPEAAAGEDAPK